MDDTTDHIRQRLAALETQLGRVSALQARQEVLHESRLNFQQEHVGVLIERADHQEQSAFDVKEVVKVLVGRVQSLEEEMELNRQTNREGAWALLELMDTMQELVRSEDEIGEETFAELFDRWRDMAQRLVANQQVEH